MPGAQKRQETPRRQAPLRKIRGIKEMTAARAEAPDGVVTSLYLRTKTLHVEAERTGVIRDLLRGQASREAYALLLRNLLPAYQAMEQGLERHLQSPGIGVLAQYRLDRAPAIESDLLALCGRRWSQDIPLLTAGDHYAQRVAKAAEGDGSRLIAHAYTRYLGDLSGGQILQRLLARSPGLHPAELTFYNFPRFSDLDALKMDYRKALDHAGIVAADRHAVIEEAAIAFSLNIDLSCAVQAAVLLNSDTN
ncbi:MAG: heme oxygenase (biliverdin-producing) [Bradyrhizobium sp.]